MLWKSKVRSNGREGGTAVAEIGMAVSRQWFDQKSNERKEETTTE